MLNQVLPTNTPFLHVSKQFSNHIQLVESWKEKGAFVQRGFVGAIQPHEVFEDVDQALLCEYLFPQKRRAVAIGIWGFLGPLLWPLLNGKKKVSLPATLVVMYTSSESRVMWTTHRPN